MRRAIDGVALVSLLDAAEIGPVADATVLYESVRDMQMVPVGRRVLMTILVPLAIPFLVLPLLRFPLDTVLGALFKALL